VTPLQRGNRLFAQKQYDEAVSAFLAHVDEFPAQAAEAYSAAAKSCRYSKDHRRSTEQYYRAALGANPEHFQSLRGLAELLPPRSEERLALLDRAARLRPDILVLIALGDYHRSIRKDCETAYGVYLRCQEAHPRDRTAYVRLNDVCRRLGRPDEAREWSARWREARA